MNPLSPQGQVRREAMLDELQLAVRSRRRRRRAVQAGVVAVPLMALGAGAIMTLRSPAPVQPAEPVVADGTPSAQGPEPLALRHIAFTETTTPETPRIETISDDELLELLRAAGHNAGMIRRGSEVTLTGVTLGMAPPPATTPGSGA